MTNGTRRGVRGQRHAPAALHPGKDSVPIVQEAGWAPGPVWTGAENLAPTGIRSTDLPGHTLSLYRMSYPAHTRFYQSLNFHYSHFFPLHCILSLCTHFSSVVCIQTICQTLSCAVGNLDINTGRDLEMNL